MADNCRGPVLIDMLVVLLCCMMKLIEMSAGKNADNNQRPRSKYRRRYVKRRRGNGKGMSVEPCTGVVRLGVGSPDSDCNSNQCTHPLVSASLLSNTSSQDIDFQDNSDYQWFLDYGYRDGGTNHHTSILSLAESYDANDLHYYDAFAKNMDANLAEADMESFRTEDIHALLTNLPPMCTDHLSQENNRQGECYASVSGSMMAKFDLDSSLSPHSSSQEGEDSTSMSICKSELLFSPVKEGPMHMPGANFSVDSLDCDMMLTCQANKDNYTIAFEGSVTMYSEDSDYHDTDKSDNSGTTGSAHWPNSNLKNHHLDNVKLLDASMTQSDSGSLTTWSKLKKKGCSENQLRRHPSGNNNNSGDEASHLGLNENSVKSQSMPNLHKQKLRPLVVSNYLKSQNSNTSTDTTVKRRPVKVFDIQNQIQSNSGSVNSVSEMATSVDASSSENTGNKQPNFSLVKLYMKQKSMSTEGMSTTMDQLSSSDNWPGSQSGESNSSESKAPEGIKNLEGSSDQKTNDSSIRIYDLIAEEPEEEVTRSESVEQLSESISKLESVDNSFEKRPVNNINCNNNFGNEINNKSKPVPTKRNLKTQKTDSSIQTSNFSEITNLKNANKCPVSNKQPIKIVEPSFLSKLKREGEIQKPVYILYPNYVLPDLDFLNEKKDDVTRVLLLPQKAPNMAQYKKRPFSCNDLEALKKKGFGHVKDWDSLNFLLPQECRQILADVPEVSDHIKVINREKPSFMYNVKHRRRPMSCDYSNIISNNPNQTNVSSSSSTATQPSSGYRGSSSILTDSQNSPAPTSNLNPLFVYRYDSVTSSEASSMTSDRPKSITTMAPPGRVSLPQGDVIPPRPPLPKGILRKGLEKVDPTKRYSMYETSEEEYGDEFTQKRKSLTEPYYLLRNKRFSETEDEGVDAGTSSSSLDDHQETFRPTTPQQKTDFLLSTMNNEELIQLDEFLKLSGISTSDHEELNEESIMQLRSYVSKFLALKINQESCEHFGSKKSVSFAEKVNVLPKHLEVKDFVAPNNSPNVSAFQSNNYQKTAEWHGVTKRKTKEDLIALRLAKHQSGIEKKLEFRDAIADSLEVLADHFESATTMVDQVRLSDTNETPALGKHLLSNLCPVLYAMLHDGLKPHIKTTFGDINNSVWQVVEASAQQGPLTKSLHDLVMKINSEDVLTEGSVKFNAFVFGLLNLRSLDAWLCYLRTRESILVKHYNPDSFLYLSHTGSLEVRDLMDSVINMLNPLKMIPFQLDLLFEYRQLQASFTRKQYHHPSDPVNMFIGPLLKKLWLTPDPSRSKDRSKNSSSTDSEDISTATVRHNTSCTNQQLPDLLNSSTNLIKAHRERPRSCIEPSLMSRTSFKIGDDITSVAKKRWSGISPNSKIHQIYERLAREEDEEYTDSLENHQVASNDNNSDESENVPSLHDEAPESLDSNFSDEKPLNGRRFKKLQQRWEMLSNKESTESLPQSNSQTPQSPTKSKIPRLIPSPVKPSGIPVFTGKTNKKVVTPPGSSKVLTSPVSIKNTPKLNSVKNSPAKRITSSPRTSRVDQLENPQETPRHVQRPSSLPYKAASTLNSKASKLTPPRRAVSSSLNRKPIGQNRVPKIVRTLSHRLPSESGHLSYNEGERLKVVLEVDEKWLLCCRGTQKGLVPKSAVISADNGRF